MPTFLTNVFERITGERDERWGRAAVQAAMAGERLISAGLRAAERGSGIVARSSSVLRRVLPIGGMAIGAAQVWRGWNELEQADSPLDVVRSRTARSGLLSIAASAMWFVPGPAGALAGAALRLTAAANELDAFRSLDAASTDVDRRGAGVARRVHVLDPTPDDPSDGLRAGLSQRAAQAAHERPDMLGRVLLRVRDSLE